MNQGPAIDRSRVILIGLLLFVAAWFLPVREHGKSLPEALPGWQAFLVALSPVWEGSYVDGLPWLNRVLWVASALTNLLVLGVLLACPWRNDRLLRVLGCALVLALSVNAQWLLNDAAGVRAGYYLWWSSFGVFSVGCLLPGRRRKLAESRPG